MKQVIEGEKNRYLYFFEWEKTKEGSRENSQFVVAHELKVGLPGETIDLKHIKRIPPTRAADLALTKMKRELKDNKKVKAPTKKGTKKVNLPLAVELENDQSFRD